MSCSSVSHYLWMLKTGKGKVHSCTLQTRFLFRYKSKDEVREYENCSTVVNPQSINVSVWLHSCTSLIQPEQPFQPLQGRQDGIPTFITMVTVKSIMTSLEPKCTVSVGVIWASFMMILFLLSPSNRGESLSHPDTVNVIRRPTPSQECFGILLQINIKST